MLPLRSITDYTLNATIAVQHRLHVSPHRRAAVWIPAGTVQNQFGYTLQARPQVLGVSYIMPTQSVGGGVVLGRYLNTFTVKDIFSKGVVGSNTPTPHVVDGCAMRPFVWSQVERYGRPANLFTVSNSDLRVETPRCLQ